MKEGNLQLPRHESVRRTLRRAGLAVLALGGVLTLIGIGSFFSSFASIGSGSVEFPRYFWCAFLGMPLLFVGSVMTMLGFLGAMNRYVAGETAPVAKDVVNYVGENVQPGVKSVAKAVAEGIKEGLSETQKNTG